MNHPFKPYPDYKPSGVEWLGDVPAHWEVKQLRNAASMRVSNVDKHVKEGEIPVRLCNYVDVYKNDYIDEQMGFMRATATSAEIRRFRLKKDDVLITKDSETWDDIGVPALVTKPASDLILGYHLALFRPHANEVIGSYLLRALQSKGLAYQFHVEAKGVTRYGLSHLSIKSIRLPLPPLPEQAAIAAYLDDICGKIHRHIEAKERLVKLLEEYRRAIIHRTVTRGLDPNVPLKPSGIEWLGDVPAHWEVKRLKHSVKLIMGQSPPGNDYSDKPIGLPFLQGCAEFGDHSPSPVQFCHTPKKVSPIGAILMSVRAPVGRFNIADQEYGIGRGLCAILPNEEVFQIGFARYQLEALTLGLKLASVGSTYDAVSIGDVGSQPSILPPLSEQTAIAAYLDKTTTDIDTAIHNTRREITLLREYRTRLIADVVTGKVDVRGKNQVHFVPVEPRSC